MIVLEFVRMKILYLNKNKNGIYKIHMYRPPGYVSNQ